MMLFYSIAKESRYKKGDDNNYIDCVIALNAKEEGDETVDESYRIKKANELRGWVSKQLNIPPLFIKPITKQEFMDSPNKE